MLQSWKLFKEKLKEEVSRKISNLVSGIRGKGLMLGIEVKN